MASLFSDLLTQLGVRHTETYSDNRYEQMPFFSLFGLTRLLCEYGVASAGIKVDNDKKKEALAQLPLPALLDTPDGFLIVTSIDESKVEYLSQHQEFTAPVDEVQESWNGIALIAAADAASCEPEYCRHHIAERMTGVKHTLLAVLAIALLGVGMWQSGLYRNIGAWILLLGDCAGLVFSWMLVQKSLGIHTKAADSVCSVIEDGGCDEIARSEASSFLGIFKWSEVGLAYFSVSLLAMLLFPATLPALAAINILCLPYTIWSITYQRFVAKTWCTLCVCVQITLWLLFAGYLIAGATRHIFPIGLDFFIIGAAYITVVLGINRLDDFLLRKFKTDK